MNISEFAKIAGVSKSAVSRYFNDGYLSDDKRALIEKAIVETGYSPSIPAHSAKNRVTKLVGVIIPKLSSESISRVVEGISAVLTAEGYELLLVNTSNDVNKEVSSLELFRSKRVDGVILLATFFTDTLLAALGSMKVPVVIAGQKLKGFNCVCHNDEGAAYSLTKLMLDKGRHRPAMIGVTRDDLAAGKARWDGFCKAVAEAGLNVPQRFMETAQFSMDSGYERAARMLSEGVLPDCIFCATDSIAMGVMLYCREAGIKVPEDVMIASVGDNRSGRVAYTTLTTAHFHYKTEGINAARMLLRELKNSDMVAKTLQLDFEIIERGSTEEI